MKVYVLMEHVYYEGDSILAIYSDRERAEAHCKSLNLENDPDHRMVNYAVHIENVILRDAPPTPQEIEDIEDCLRRWRLKNP
jgi:hypothetical protein